MLSALVERPYSQIPDLGQYRLSDEQLRSWFSTVNSRLNQLPPQAFDFSKALEQELGTVVHEAFLGVK
jgi:hypothetical protein